MSDHLLIALPARGPGAAEIARWVLVRAGFYAGLGVSSAVVALVVTAVVMPAPEAKQPLPEQRMSEPGLPASPTRPVEFKKSDPTEAGAVATIEPGQSIGQSQGGGNYRMVGGAGMYAPRTIIEDAVRSKDHTTLVAAVKAAGLVDTLAGKGPFTVFAPTNSAFAALPPGAIETLVKPENKASLSKILTYHVVRGAYTSADLLELVAKGNGTARLTTVEGETLAVTRKGDQLLVADKKGDLARLTIPDVAQSNGVIHVIDKVLIP